MSPLAEEIDGQVKRSKKQVLGQLADLLERNNIPLDEIDKVNRINAWQGMYAKLVACDTCQGIEPAPEEPKCRECGGTGKVRVPEKVDMVGIQLVPSWASGPEWPVVQPAKPTIIRHRQRKPVVRAGKVTVILPDPQIGFWRLSDGTMVSMHDEQAMALTLDLIDAIRPNRIVNLGDFFDFAEWSSKFAVSPEFVMVTQPTLDRGHRYLAEQKAAAGPELEDQFLFEGNHDNRLALMIMANAKAALRLRQAGQPPDSWPVLSIPHLAGLDSLGVTYVGAYPAGRLKLADAHGRQTPLYARHGHSTDMAKLAKTEGQSVVQGHAHHVALASETREVDCEPREIEAWSLGCLCRTDGAVPSTGGGSDHNGPVVHHESWQQAIGVLTETEDGWDVDPIRIRDGRARYQGKEYRREAA